MEWEKREEDEKKEVAEKVEKLSFTLLFSRLLLKYSDSLGPWESRVTSSFQKEPFLPILRIFRSFIFFQQQTTILYSLEFLPLLKESISFGHSHNSIFLSSSILLPLDHLPSEKNYSFFLFLSSHLLFIIFMIRRHCIKCVTDRPNKEEDQFLISSSSKLGLFTTKLTFNSGLLLCSDNFSDMEKKELYLPGY